MLELLPGLYGEVVVPPAVAREIERGRKLGYDLPELGKLPWLSASAPTSTILLSLAAGLGAGELEVLALGRERDEPLVILDDARARRCAAVLGLRYTGTLGVLLKAKQVGSVASIRPLVERLEQLGFRLHPATRTSCLDLAGEDD